MSETYERLLIGKVLSRVDLASDKKALRLNLDGESVVAKCDGDCCSSTWVESIELPAGGLPAQIISVDDLELPSIENSDGLIQFYGLRIRTDKGDMTIDYRNESNGYYGGNLAWPGDYHYGGVYGQNDSSEEWAPAHE